VILVPDANVLFAGDLLEADATPFFGDGYPLDWPDTVERLVDLVTGAVVPGHGTVGDRAFAVSQMAGFREVAELGPARRCGRDRHRRRGPADALPGRRRDGAADPGDGPDPGRAGLATSRP
jgi:glyoxylase-like metal-dependent hydrolase (beta-lactamase superfamily II)